MRHRYPIALGVLALALIAPAARSSSLPPIPPMILGVNQAGVGSPDKITDPAKPLWLLTDADLDRLKAIGSNTVRFPVYPEDIGVSRSWFLWKTGDGFDAESASKVTPDWRALDAVIDQLARHGLTPYICPHPMPTSWITLYIREDADRCFWFSSLIARHVHEKYGDNVIYGWYENIWKNSMEPWMMGEYKHLISAEFPWDWHRMLRRFYGGKIESLNGAWGASYTSFDEIPIPEIGSVRGVPASAMVSRRTWDLRRAVDMISRERLTRWRRTLRGIAPGAFWAGACLHDGFYGMGDSRSGNPPKCNWGIRTHAITSDALAADNYQSPNKLKAAYRTIAKIASVQGKRFMAVEINANDVRAFPAIVDVAAPMRGALIWCGREDAFGLLSADGAPRERSLNAARTMFSALSAPRVADAEYKPGSVHVYYPEETYEYAVLEKSQIDAYEHVCDNLPANKLEPVLTDEIARLPKDVPIFVLEKYLPSQAIAALNELGSRVVSPYPYFIDENGRQIARSFTPKDFYAQLRKAPGGSSLMEAFLRAEEKEHGVALRDMGASATTSSEFSKANEIDPGKPYDPMDLIDGDSVATRVVFADKEQDEIVDVTLPKETRVYGAFAESAFEDPGRRPSAVTVSVSLDGKAWTQVGKARTLADRTHLRFDGVRAKYVRFDLGRSIDKIGTRLIEVGVLGDE